MGAKSIGRPWLIGGYKGSNNLAATALDRVSSDDLAHAWVLEEPKGPRTLSEGLLTRYGIDMRRDYQDVGTVMSPVGTYAERYEQHLLKPIRVPETERAIKEFRH